MMEKIRIPKTSNVHHSKDFKQINFMRNNLLQEDATSRTDDFLRKLNYSFDNYKITKNKVQLKALDEKPLPVKPASRPPVFERLTQGLLKNPRRKKKENDANSEESKEPKTQKIKKVLPIGKFGDTGSSFDRIIERAHEGKYQNLFVFEYLVLSSYSWANTWLQRVMRKQPLCAWLPQLLNEAKGEAKEYA